MICSKIKVLIIYDITTTKRRNQVIKVLNSYGIRVQKSAFEIYIDKKKIKNVIEELRATINKNEDSIRIYEIIENENRIMMGIRSNEEGIRDVYII